MLTVLIDGPSGSGKSTYAEALGRHWGLPVVHLDSFYPGWSGLAAAAAMVGEDVLHPSHPGYRRWDWVDNRPAGWVDLDPRASMIVEGVGAVTRASISKATQRGDVLTVRVCAPAALRRRRALKRDPSFEPWWDMWAAQEREHFAGAGNVPVHLRIEMGGGE